MHARLIGSTALAAMAFSLVACAAKPQAVRQNAGNPAIFQGRATVLEIHNELGYALLSMDGRAVYGYWQPDASIGQPGTISHSGAFGAAVGEAKEPLVRHQDFPAKVGDTIAFRGMRTGGEIYLSAVGVVGR